MKLAEVKQLSEGVVPYHITFQLQAVIDAGKITNSVQTFCLANLTELFRNAESVTSWPRTQNGYGATANAEAIGVIKSMSDHEVVQLAKLYLSKLTDIENSPPLKNDPKLMTLDWIKHVLHRQD